MALPFPPAEEIPAMYARLQKMTSTQKLQQLMQYVGRNRITGNTWPSSRSVFMKSVWTNNDIEGWHLGLNHRASGKSQLPLYLLIRLLHHEAFGHPFRSGLCPRRSYGAFRKKVPRPPNQDLQPLGWVQLWYPLCKKTTKGVFLPQRPSTFIKRLF